MRMMFQNCNELEYLDLSNFNTSNVTDMTAMFNESNKIMFQNCYELEYLNLSNFDTSNVTDMTCMFNKCQNLKIIEGFNNFINIKVNYMGGCFNYLMN